MMTKNILWVGILGGVLLMSGAASAASISGTVKVTGNVPKLKEMRMDADPACAIQHDVPLKPPFFSMGPDQTLGDVFVRIVEGLPKQAYPAPTEEVTLTQKGCMYTPHVIGIMVGQKLKIFNPDGIMHNVHGKSKINPSFNISMPEFLKETVRVFDKPEFIFSIECNVHPWMKTWVGVLDHPFFAISGKDGRYTINNVPAGRYTIEAWHEKLGIQRVTLDVTEGSDSTANWAFAFPEPK